MSVTRTYKPWHGRTDASPIGILPYRTSIRGCACVRARGAPTPGRHAIGLLDKPEPCRDAPQTRGTACGPVWSCVQRRVQAARNCRWLSQMQLES